MTEGSGGGVKSPHRKDSLLTEAERATKRAPKTKKKKEKGGKKPQLIEQGRPMKRKDKLSSDRKQFLQQSNHCAVGVRTCMGEIPNLNHLERGASPTQREVNWGGAALHTALEPIPKEVPHCGQRKRKNLAGREKKTPLSLDLKEKISSGRRKRKGRQLRHKRK